jgi:CDP-diglyceride synthetase
LGARKAGLQTDEETIMFDDPALAFLPIFFIAIALVLAAIAMVPWFFIYKKAGFHPAMGCLMFIPVVNLIMMFILAFTEWPIERELQQHRQAQTARTNL